MTVCVLVKAGFGSRAEIEALDTTDFLDLVEFMEISNAVENHLIDEACNNGGS